MRPRAKSIVELSSRLWNDSRLPVLEAMGKKVSETTHVVSVPCTLPTECHFRTPTRLDEWSWFPRAKKMVSLFLVSRQGFRPFRDQLSFLGGLYHPKGRNRPACLLRHVADWSSLQDPKREVYNGVALDQVVAKHTEAVLQNSPLL